MAVVSKVERSKPRQELKCSLSWRKTSSPVTALSSAHMPDIMSFPGDQSCARCALRERKTTPDQRSVERLLMYVLEWMCRARVCSKH